MITKRRADRLARKNPEIYCWVASEDAERWREFLQRAEQIGTREALEELGEWPR